MSGKEPKKKKLSYGKIISDEDLKNENIFPSGIKESIQIEDYYLIVCIPGESHVKINLFPVKTRSIRKLLVKMTAFSPEMVKSIGESLNDLRLGDRLIHTTGLCFADAGCCYESYLNIDELDKLDLSIEKIKEKFNSIENVLDVFIKEIEGSD